LSWDDFGSNIRESFKGFRDEQEYFDVTLACDDGSTIEAHKMILSAGSQLFKNIFRKSKHPSPFVYFKGINRLYLDYVLDFLYNGEVNISQEELSKFLETAKELQVKGLQTELENPSGLYQTEEKDDEELESKKEKTCSITDLNLKLEEDASILDSAEHVEESLISNDSSSNDGSLIGSEEVGVVNINTELAVQIEQMLEKEGTLWKCKKCGKLGKHKNNVKNHIETHIQGISHSCHFCNKTCPTRPSLAVHIGDYHSQQIFDCKICGMLGMSKMKFKNHKVGHKKAHQS